jgi:chromosome partitioning protein
MAGNRVAILDLDPQGNATLAVEGMNWADAPPSEGTALEPLKPLAERLWMLPSPGAQMNLGRDARPDPDALQQLRHQLESEPIDWLLVDCPPRMDIWGWTGLALCDEVLVPVQSEFFGMHGLSQMLRTLEQAQRELDGRGRLFGVLPTMVDGRDSITLEVLENLRANLGTKVLDSVIYRDAQFVEAASHGVSLFDYNVFAVGARSYGELVREVMHGRT